MVMGGENVRVVFKEKRRLKMSRMLVRKKVIQSHGILLYKDESGYCVRAYLKEKVEVGDEIEYEPYGLNFGWLERVIRNKENKNE